VGTMSPKSNSKLALGRRLAGDDGMMTSGLLAMADGRFR